MTIRATPPVSLSDVMAELRVTNPGRAYPIALGDADVRTLAGKSSGQISLSDLFGKSGQAPLTATAVGQSNSFSSASSGGTASGSATVTPSGGSGGYTYAWSVVSSSSGVSIGALNGPSVSMSRTYVKSTVGTASAVFNVTVTDSQGHTATVNNVSVTVDWTNNL